MSAHLESTDYVPSLDHSLDDDTKNALNEQIHEEASQDRETTLHPLIGTSYEPQFSALMMVEHERLASSAPKTEGTGIDLTRYEADALEPPNRTSPDSDEKNPELLDQWRETMQKAYVSSTYLAGRNTNLGLLETYGRNAWLIANWHQEGELKSLEKELADVKARTEALTEERRRDQENGSAELNLLEETWKKGVRGIVEVQVATESLKAEILEARKQGAS